MHQNLHPTVDKGIFHLTQAAFKRKSSRGEIAMKWH